MDRPPMPSDPHDSVAQPQKSFNSNFPPPDPSAEATPSYGHGRHVNAKRRRSLGWRIAGYGAASVGVAATFALATVGSVFLHTGLPAGRRVVASTVTQILDPMFQGKIVVEQVNRLSLLPVAIDGLSAKIYAPDGDEVAAIAGGHARVGLYKLIASLVDSKKPMDVDVKELTIDNAEVKLVAQTDGTLTIQHAFDPKTPSPPDTTPGKGVLLEFPDVHLKHAWAHGAMSGQTVDVELADVAANARIAPDDIQASLSKVSVTARALLPEPVLATLDGQLDMPVIPTPVKATPEVPIPGAIVLPDLTANVHLNASAGDVKVAITGALAKNQIAATVDLPETQPAAIQHLVPTAPVYQPVSLHLQAQGPLNNVVATAHAAIGAKGTVDLSANADVGDPDKSANATIAAQHVDIEAFSPGTKSDLNTTVTAVVKMPNNGALSGTYKVDNKVGTVSGQAIPSAQIAGNFTQNRVDGHAVVNEPGAPTELSFSLDPSSPKATTPSIVRFDTTTDVADLTAVKRIGALGKGALKVRLVGQMDLNTKVLDAHAAADAYKLSVGPATVGHLNLAADVKGSVAALGIDARVRAESIDASGYKFDHLTVVTSGSTKAGHVDVDVAGSDKNPSATASADFSLANGVDVTKAKLSVSRNDQTLNATIARVHSANGALDVDGVHVEGVGQPLDAEMHMHGDAIAVKAHAADLELKKLAALAGQANEINDGHAAIDVDLKASKRDAKGYASLKFDNVLVENYPALSGMVKTTFDGQAVVLRESSKVEGLATLDIQTSDVTLAGGPLDPAAWKHAVGKVDVESNVVIERAFDFVPPGSPIGEASGTVHMLASAARPTPNAAPDLAIGIVTRNLVVAAARPIIKPVRPTTDAAAANGTKPAAADPKAQAAVANASQNATAQQPTAPGASTQARTASMSGGGHKPLAQTSLAAPPWQSRGMDVRFLALVDGDENTVDLKTTLTDGLGVFAKLNASTKLPMNEVMAEVLSDPSKIKALAMVAPVQAHLDIPRRKAGKFPTIVPQLPVAGELEMSADVQGTATEPKTKIAFNGYDLHPSGHKKENLNASIVVETDDKGGTLKFDATHEDLKTKQSASVLNGNAALHLNGSLKDVINGGDFSKLPWDAEAHLAMTDFPLAMVPSGQDSTFKGTVKGNIDLTGLHKDANVKVALDTTAIDLGKARLVDSGTVRVAIGGGKLDADVKLAQKSGAFEAKANGGLSWGSALAPSLDKTTPLDSSLEAKNFELAGIAPFADSAVNDLSGKLDADAKIHLAPDPKDVNMSGSVTVANGSMEVPALGEQLQHVNAKVSMKSDGTITLEDMEADPATGHVKIVGGAKFAGMNFQSAEAHVAIKNGQEIPIASQGVAYGDAWGNVDAKVTSADNGNRLNVDVSVPTLHMHLPQSTGHSVQALDADPDITIGRRTASGRMQAIALAAPAPPATPSDSVTHIAVHIGKDVYIKRDTTLKIDVTGDPVIDMQGSQTTMSGALKLTGGKLEINGKGFEIDQGTVTFNGDPANPVVIVEAHWDAPDSDKTRVTAEFVGPVKTGKVTLRSEPSLSQNEILSLILFGSADESLGSSDDANSTGTATAGAAAAGGVATQAVNKALSGVTKDTVTTRVDTSESDNPRPDIGWQISHDVQAHILVNLGLPAPGDNPDDEMLQVDWRFIRSWTLTGTVGDAGSSLLDLAWRIRY